MTAYTKKSTHCADELETRSYQLWENISLPQSEQHYGGQVATAATLNYWLDPKGKEARKGQKRTCRQSFVPNHCARKFGLNIPYQKCLWHIIQSRSVITGVDGSRLAPSKRNGIVGIAGWNVRRIGHKQELGPVGHAGTRRFSRHIEVWNLIIDSRFIAVPG